MNSRIILLGSIVAGALVITAACKGDEGELGTGGNGAGTSTGAGMTTGGGGSGGQEVITNTCQAYCSAMQSTCIDLNQQYLDDDDCVDVCTWWPEGQTGQTNDNTLACRNYYLAFANDSADDAESNCRFAGPHTEGKCDDNCFNFCFLAQNICTGNLEQWPSEQSCREDCNDWPNNQPYYTGVIGDNFGCRMKYLTIAADNPNVGSCSNIQGMDDLCVDPPMMGGMGGMPIGGMGGIGGIPMMGGMGGIGGMPVIGGMGGIGGIIAGGMGGIGGN
jgi:hypothetical protein